MQQGHVPAQVSAWVMTPALPPITCRAIRSTRRVISAAARREKVISRIRRDRPIDHQMGDPVGHGVGLPGARAGDDQERRPGRCVLLLDAMLDGASLFAIEGLEIGGGHRWQIGLQQAKPIKPSFSFCSQL